jgi:hypothetical protein
MKSIVPTLAVLVSIIALGCSQDSKLNRKPVFGKIVGADGRGGIVTFTPTDGTIGPAATRSFENGAYQFSEKDGPVPGNYIASVELALANTTERTTRQWPYEPEKKTAVSVPVDGPYELDLNPTESESQ